jgi:serine protease
MMAERCCGDKGGDHRANILNDRSSATLVDDMRALAVALALASSFQPNDPGRSGQPGGWVDDQWNFLPGTGVNAPQAWDNLIAKGRPGGKGVKVAVLDTGVAYEDRDKFRRSPDLSRYRFAKGRDFCAHSGPNGDPCDGEDAYPDDPNGHGTHVASTIAEATYNGIGETGLAYGATIMPVKVLDRNGYGDEQSIAQGIRYAVDHGAQVINLSFEFDASIDSPSKVPLVVSALRHAKLHRVLVVAAAGNAARTRLAYPAGLSGVLAVGAVTEHGCLADYSDSGPGLDLVAPGGGNDAVRADDPNCHPETPGRPIIQMTYTTSKRNFGLPTDYIGTSMAAPHVSATAALVIASGVLGTRPTPKALETRLKATARDLGARGRDATYGSGIVDAGAATSAAVK